MEFFLIVTRLIEISCLVSLIVLLADMRDRLDGILASLRTAAQSAGKRRK